MVNHNEIAVGHIAWESTKGTVVSACDAAVIAKVGSPAVW